MRRLWEDVLCSNLCWLFVCSATSLPVPVMRIRLLAPLWVFCFGMSSSCSSLVGASSAVLQGPAASSRARGAGGSSLSGGGRLPLGRRLLLRLGRAACGVARCLVPVRSDHHDHVAAVLLRVGLDDAQLADVGGQPLEQPVAHLRSRLLAASEHDGDLDLVAALEEALDVALLGLVVVRVDLQAQPHLLDDGERLVPPGLAGLLGGLVLELPVVHELADRRPGHGSDLDEVELRVLGQSQCFADRHDADLLTLGADQADLGDTDAVVDAGLGDGLSSALAYEESPVPDAERTKAPGAFAHGARLTGLRTDVRAATTDRWPVLAIRGPERLDGV